jgi:preprotein translocase subunit YajC
MSSTWLVSGLYFVLFLLLLTGIFFWRRHQRKSRQPFPDQLKLLRGPGETQLRIVRKFEEDLVQHFLGALVVPLIAAGSFLWCVAHIGRSWQIAGLLISLVALVVIMYFAARYLVLKIEQANNRYLGFFGERVVAEALEPLKTRGWRVFHDIPCGDAKSPFNIDHVVVGSGGVFAIETKTRRKGRARDGFAAHEIIYDGSVLAYPWGEDRHGLDQAQRQAQWLAGWIAKQLGVHVTVWPLLTFPGWMIIRRGKGTVVVVNPKELPSAIESRPANTLDSRQIDLIARQLDARCRDVEF